MEGFSVGRGDTGFVFCGSVGGAACPLPLRFSVLGTAMPFLEGFGSGDPIADDVAEGGGDGREFAAISLFLFAPTDATIVVNLERFDDALGTRTAEVLVEGIANR